MKRNICIFLLFLCMITPLTSWAVSKNITVTWTMGDISDVSGYRMYYAYNAEMTEKNMACETSDSSVASLTCDNIDLVKSPVYIEIAAITSQGESISTASSATFSTVAISPVQGFQLVTAEATPPVTDPLVISDVTPSYPIRNSAVGDTAYTDRSYTITDLSSELTGIKAIQTANNDKYNTAASFLSFAINQPATLYIAYDSRATSYPSWLTDGYTRQTSLSVTTTDNGLVYTVWEKSVPAGTVTIPGNLYGSPANVGSMYLVFLK